MQAELGEGRRELARVQAELADLREASRRWRAASETAAFCREELDRLLDG